MRVVTLSSIAAVVSLLLLPVNAFTTTAPRFGISTQQSSSELYGVRTFIKNTLSGENEDEDEALPVTTLEPPSLETETKPRFAARDIQEGT
jgi:hypothetical protein